MGFQKQVNTVQAPAVLGDFASANPRFLTLAGQGGLVAGSSLSAVGGVPLAGILVGRFGWLSYSAVDNDSAPAVVNNFGAGKPDGFLHRDQQGLITIYLQESSLLLPTGFQTSLFSSGDFWTKNEGATQALPGMKAYANLSTGQASFAAAGTAFTASGSASSIAAATNGFTASISGNQMTVSAVGSGSVYPGTTITGTGVPAGTKIVAQLSGTPQGVGVYALNVGELSIASEAMTGTYGLLTVGGTVVAGFGVGQPISGTNVVAGTTITALGTGLGGAGTYVVDNNTVVSSTAITANTSVETDWTARSGGLVGEIVKVSRLP